MKKVGTSQKNSECSTFKRLTHDEWANECGHIYSVKWHNYFLLVEEGIEALRAPMSCLKSYILYKIHIISEPGSIRPQIPS